MVREDLPIDVPTMKLECHTCGAMVAGAYNKKVLALFTDQHDGHDTTVEVPNTAETET